jgi:DNA mismatch repair protein MutH
MNDEKKGNDLLVDVAFASAGLLLLGALGATAISVAYQDGYKAGIKDSPATVNVSGDQIITNTNSSLSPFSGNGNTKKVETGSRGK